jgi:hypothetical protein
VLHAFEFFTRQSLIGLCLNALLERLDPEIEEAEDLPFAIAEVAGKHILFTSPHIPAQDVWQCKASCTSDEVERDGQSSKFKRHTALRLLQTRAILPTL